MVTEKPQGQQEGRETVRECGKIGVQDIYIMSKIKMSDNQYNHLKNERAARAKIRQQL